MFVWYLYLFYGRNKSAFPIVNLYSHLIEIIFFHVNGQYQKSENKWLSFFQLCAAAFFKI